MVRLAVHALLICAAAAVLVWGTTSGRTGIFIDGEAPESGWSTAGELSEEHKHCHDTSAGTVVDSVAIEVVRYFESLADQSILYSSVGERIEPLLRGPPRI